MKSMVSRENNLFPTDHSKAVPLLLLQLSFVCVLLISYLAFVLSLFVLHLSFFRWLGKAVFRTCGIPQFNLALFLFLFYFLFIFFKQTR